MDSVHVNEESLKQTFSEYLKKKRLRQTIERSTIFDKICQTEGIFTVDMIWQSLEDDNFHVSRASIYNTLDLLSEALIVVKHQFATINQVRYELKCISDQYHHLICVHCGSIQNIRNEKVKKLVSTIKTPKFTTEYYMLNFYGICSKCKYRLMRERIKEESENRKKQKKNQS